MYSILWLVALIIFGVVEAATVGLASIWFAAGALAALILSAFLNSLLVQVVVFLAVSFVTLLLVRPLAQADRHQRRPRHRPGGRGRPGDRQPSGPGPGQGGRHALDRTLRR